MTSPDTRPGRTCPLGYRYAPSALAREPDFQCETLYAVGGLYGNPFALNAVLALAREEPGPVEIVFNGDFNWFDIDAATFAAVNETVLGHRALRGNVETELANASGAADCGCGYPDSVGDAEVARSNAIMARLHATAEPFAAVRAALARLPMHLVAEIGGKRVGIVHGDLESLAGWTYTPDVLGTTTGRETLRGHFQAANLDVIASSHTCRPLAVSLEVQGRKRALFNNGAAGMPNFRGDLRGVVTRVSTRARGDALYGAALGGLHVEALPVAYDHARWIDAFLANWPAGSSAHDSYFDRITRGTSVIPAQAGIQKRLSTAPRSLRGDDVT